MDCSFQHSSLLHWQDVTKYTLRCITYFKMGVKESVQRRNYRHTTDEKQNSEHKAIWCCEDLELLSHQFSHNSMKVIWVWHGWNNYQKLCLVASIDHQLEETVKSCQVCRVNKKSLLGTPFNLWETMGQNPYGFCRFIYRPNDIGFSGCPLKVDWDHSMDTSTSGVMISKLCGISATPALPRTVFTDNGRNFPIFTVPHHLASNSFVERAVQVVKKMKKGDLMTKCAWLLFYYWNMPHSSTGCKLSELMFQCKVRIHFDAVQPDLGTKIWIQQNK